VKMIDNIEELNAQNEVLSAKNIIYINVDDEKGVLNMNKRLFLKLNILLHTCFNKIQLINLLDTLILSIESKTSIVVIMDYHLENELGTYVLKHINENYLGRNNVEFSLYGLTSTEDIVVMNEFNKQFVNKV